MRQNNGQKKIILYFILLFILNYLQLYSQDQTQKNIDKYHKTEKFLYKYYTDDLQINAVVVKIDKEVVAISCTPDFRIKEKAIVQIVLAISGAGISAPWTKDICITIQIQGMPIGFIEIPTKKALLASEGKISPKAFISSFVTTQLSLPFNFPIDLLIPVTKSDKIWQDTSIIECNGSKIEELLNVNLKDFLPEFLQAAFVKTKIDNNSQSSIAGVIDFEKEIDAIDFISLNTTQSTNKQIYRIGTIIYILKGSKEIVLKAISALQSKNQSKNIVKIPLNTKYFIIIAGFIFLIFIIVIVYILSGRENKKDSYSIQRDNKKQQYLDNHKIFKKISIPTASLIIKNSDNMDNYFKITNEITKIGRVCRGKHDINILDDTLSRHQATIIYNSNKNQFHINNNSKTNPTILNNKIVSGSMILHNNDIVKMGQFTFVFKRNV